MSKNTRRDTFQEVLLENMKRYAMNSGKKLLGQAASAATSSVLEGLTAPSPKKPPKSVKSTGLTRRQTANSVAAPVARGGAVGANQYTFKPVSRYPADCDTTNGVTVCGSTMLDSSIYSTTVAGALDRPAIDIRNTAVVNVFVDLRFEDLDDRLFAMATVHLWYRFRKLRIRYQSTQPTSSPGMVGLALTDSWNPTIAYYPRDLKDLLTIRTSAASNVWNSFDVPTYTYNGTKVFSTRFQNGGTEPDETWQVVLFGRTDCSISNTPLGRIFVEYEIDFYEPIANNGAITMSHLTFCRNHLGQLSEHEKELLLGEVVKLYSLLKPESEFEQVTTTSSSSSSTSSMTVYPPAVSGTALQNRR